MRYYLKRDYKKFLVAESTRGSRLVFMVRHKNITQLRQYLSSNIARGEVLTDSFGNAMELEWLMKYAMYTKTCQLPAHINCREDKYGNAWRV